MLYFYNSGELDIAGAITLGVSVKDSSTPIGRFGTGFKFAIATILRFGGGISIHSGDTTYEFSKRATTIRGKPFDIVTMNGQPLGFTTELGRDWEMWMAYRELASNAIDEGGSTTDDAATIVKVIGCGSTVIVADHPDLDRAHRMRDSIFFEQVPQYENIWASVVAGPEQHIFYRKVRSGRMRNPLLFKYNIDIAISLTEDRTFKYHFEVDRAIRNFWLHCTDKNLLKAMMLASDEYYEHYIDFMADVSGGPSDMFVKAAEELCHDIALSLKANSSAMRMVRGDALSNLTESDSVQLNVDECAMMARAQQLLINDGFPVTDYPIIVMLDLGNGVSGLAKNNKIYVSKLAFAMGLRELAATLLEEFIHIRTGHRDETRALQNYLFERIVERAMVKDGCETT